MASKPSMQQLRQLAERLPLNLPPARDAVLRQQCEAIHLAEQADRRDVAASVEQLNAKAVELVLAGKGSDFGAVETLEADLAVRSSARQREIAALEAAIAADRRTGDQREIALSTLRDEVQAITADLIVLQAEALRAFRDACELETAVKSRAFAAAGEDARRVCANPHSSPRHTLLHFRNLFKEWWDQARKDGYDGPC